jgi:hydroxypyruvate isomerase
MRRRRFLQTVAGAPLTGAIAQTRKTPGFKLSVRVEPVLPDMSLAERMEKVAEARFHAFEFGDWRSADPAAVNPLKNKLGIECSCIVGNRGVNPRGMTLTNPEDRDGFLTEIKASIEAARRFETRRMITLTGNQVPDMGREAQHESIVEGLKRAAGLVEPHGITLIVEPLNTLVDHKGYYLNHAAEAFEIIRKVDSPFVKVLFDIYHAQIMDGNLIDTLRSNIKSIDHFHVGDVPGRHEPGSGEIDYGNVFKAIHATGYSGFVAMEYLPSKDPMETLRAVRALYDACAVSS